mgnify:FL=1
MWRAYNGRMSGERGPQWRISEDAGESVLLTLYLRQALGLRSPEDLPHLRGVPAGDPAVELERSELEQATLERQWRELWAMTVEPQAHPSHVPLDLVEGFGTLLALPAQGSEALRAAMSPFAKDARAYARLEHARHKARTTASTGSSYRGYASAIAGFEREVGRRAHSFDLNVQVLPLQQRGVWWIGSLTIAVTDGLRADVAAFDTAIHPIIAELA